METNKTANQPLDATAHIVSSYVLNHKTDLNELEIVIQRVHNTLSRLNQNANTTVSVSNSDVSIEDSVTPDYIVCLEDGKKLKMLKRYLKTNYNMTPEEYRKRWGLPATYPMVAPNYAKKRSQLAKNIGLGKKPSGNSKAKIAAQKKVQRDEGSLQMLSHSVKGSMAYAS